MCSSLKQKSDWDKESPKKTWAVWLRTQEHRPYCPFVTPVTVVWTHRGSRELSRCPRKTLRGQTASKWGFSSFTRAGKELPFLLLVCSGDSALFLAYNMKNATSSEEKVRILSSRLREISRGWWPGVFWKPINTVMFCVQKGLPGRQLGVGEQTMWPQAEAGSLPITKTFLSSQKILSNMQGTISIMAHICKIHSRPHLTNIYRVPRSATFFRMYGDR